MFTKRHYKAIAEVLRANQPDRPVSTSCEGHRARFDKHRSIVGKLAALFANDNPRFNRDRFLAACGEE